MKTLVIGIGNELRGDDAVGRKLVESVAQAGWADTLSVIQLTPELAANISAYQRVVFADAGESLRFVPVPAETPKGPGRGPFSHQVTPAALLALAELLYQQKPEGWLLELPAENFQLGQRLTETARQGLERAVSYINRAGSGVQEWSIWR